MGTTCDSLRVCDQDCNANIGGGICQFDSQGNMYCKCNTGFQGENCYQACQTDCGKYGRCNLNGNCTCMTGVSGALCTMGVPTGVISSSGGISSTGSILGFDIGIVETDERVIAGVVSVLVLVLIIFFTVYYITGRRTSHDTNDNQYTLQK